MSDSVHVCFMKPAFFDPITGWCISSFAPRSPSKSETLCVRRTPWGPCPEVTAVTSSPPLPATGSRASPGSLCFPNPRRSHALYSTFGTRSPGGTGVSSRAASPLRGIDGPLAPPAGRPSPPSIPAWGEEEETWSGAPPTPPSPILTPQPPLLSQLDSPYPTQNTPTPSTIPLPPKPLHRRWFPTGNYPKKQNQQGNKGTSKDFKCFEGVCFSP